MRHRPGGLSWTGPVGPLRNAGRLPILPGQWRGPRQSPLSKSHLTTGRSLMANLYLARQPIFDADLSVRGYELLYRGAPGAERPDADQMTSTVLVNALLEIGLDNVV